MSAVWKKLFQAARLTRAARLAEATREIQRALGGGREPAERKTVDARFDPPSPPSPAVDAPPSTPSLRTAADAAGGPAEGAASAGPVEAGRPVGSGPAGRAGVAGAAGSADSLGSSDPIAPAPAPAPSAHPAAPPAAAPAPFADDPEAVLDAEPPPGRFVPGRAATAFGTRDFKLHVPGGDLADGRARPLLVLLHGCKQDPDDFARGTGMNRLADRLGAFVLYPAQGQRSNAMRCWNWFQPQDQKRGAGEPALLAAMVADVVRDHPIDAERVYVAGLSAGGAMAAILARHYPDVFAAAGIHSGLAPGAARDVGSAFQAMSSPSRVPSSATADPAGAPLIVFQGDADTTVHPSNARHVIASLLGAAAAATVQEASEPGRPGLGWTRSVFREAGAATTAAGTAGPSRAELWLVQGLGHAWSGGSASGTYTEPKGPDASRAMLRFFVEHPRRPSPGR